MNIESKTITGWSKGFEYDKLGELTVEPDHAWNAAKIDQRWLIFDATWGRGKQWFKPCGLLGAKKEYKKEWFDTDPFEFVLTHIPEVDLVDQFLDDPLTKAEFKKLPKIDRKYFQENIDYNLPALFTPKEFIQNFRSVASSKFELFPSENDLFQIQKTTNAGIIQNSIDYIKNKVLEGKDKNGFPIMWRFDYEIDILQAPIEMVTGESYIFEIFVPAARMIFFSNRDLGSFSRKGPNGAFLFKLEVVNSGSLVIYAYGDFEGTGQSSAEGIMQYNVIDESSEIEEIQSEVDSNDLLLITEEGRNTTIAENQRVTEITGASVRIYENSTASKNESPGGSSTVLHCQILLPFLLVFIIY